LLFIVGTLAQERNDGAGAWACIIFIGGVVALLMYIF
jgi:hypothetical protein